MLDWPGVLTDVTSDGTLPAMAAVNAVAGGGERRCYTCSQPGHLREDGDKLHPEVREYLKQQAARGRGRGRGRSRGRGCGGPAVAAISTAYVQHMVDSLPGESSAFLPDKWLVDSGADLNICFNSELFSYIGPPDVDICTPIGSTQLDVPGRGVVKMRVGQYVDHDGLSTQLTLRSKMCDHQCNVMQQCQQCGKHSGSCCICMRSVCHPNGPFVKVPFVRHMLYR